MENEEWTHMSLNQYLRKIQDEAKRREEARQKVQAAMRSATRLSKNAILMVHQKRFHEAEKTIEEVRDLFSKVEEASKNNVDLLYSGIVNAAYQEYSEACVFLKLVKENEFASSEEIGAPAVSYVLGLADVIGELRRKVLDSLREGESSLAEKFLVTMDLIYTELTGMGDAYFLIPGLRRKCDVARRIIEATRGDVTIDTRRRSLENSIQKLEEALKEN